MKTGHEPVFLFFDFLEASEILYNQRNQYRDYNADKIQPQITQLFFSWRIHIDCHVVDDKNGKLAAYCGPENGLRLYIFDIKSD